MRVVEELNAALHALMEADENVYVLGEDILDPYGGAFKVTKGLSARYTERVLTMPISESGLVGFALGLSLCGKTAIAEIMFGDFLTLAMDQLLNQAAKVGWMSGDVLSAGLIVRTPMGGGRGYGPTHSQCIEKHFCGVPGLTVLAVNAFASPGALLKKAYDLRSPVLFIENKVMYSKAVEPERIRRTSQPDVAILCYGGVAEACVRAAERLYGSEEIDTNVVVVEQLSPLDARTVLDGVAGSDCIVTVEEGTQGWGFGAECARVMAEAGVRPRKFLCFAAPAMPIPSAREWETAILPDERKIFEAVLNLVSS